MLGIIKKHKNLQLNPIFLNYDSLEFRGSVHKMVEIAICTTIIAT